MDTIPGAAEGGTASSTPDWAQTAGTFTSHRAVELAAPLILGQLPGLHIVRQVGVRVPQVSRQFARE